MSNFDFLQREWFAIHDTCVKAESYVNSDARAACFYARIALEQMVGWLYKYDNNYSCYDENLGARVYEPCFRNTAGDAIFTKSMSRIYRVNFNITNVFSCFFNMNSPK